MVGSYKSKYIYTNFHNYFIKNKNFYRLKNNILPNSFFDYKVFVAADADNVDFIVIGQGEKKILWILNDQPEQEDFLQKISAAAKLELLKDVFLVRVSAETSTLSIQKFIKINFVTNIIVMGTLPNFLGLNFRTKKYEVKTFQGVKYLFTDDLSAISLNNNLKKDLWTAMQTMFL